jgi:hypothetical protein
MTCVEMDALNVDLWVMQVKAINLLLRPRSYSPHDSCSETKISYEIYGKKVVISISYGLYIDDIPNEAIAPRYNSYERSPNNEGGG